MDKSNNELLFFGVGILIIGIVLLSYSISTYVEVKNLKNKIDFEMLDNNNQMSFSDKYYKYLSYADYLSRKLEKNKGIPIKNSSCVYLNYAQLNAVKLYNLVDRKSSDIDGSKRDSAVGNVKTLVNLLDSYKTCKHVSDYKAELEKIISDSQNAENRMYESEMRMNNFLNTSKSMPADDYTMYETDVRTPVIAPDEIEDTNKMIQQYN